MPSPRLLRADHAVYARRSLVGLDPLPRALPKLSLASTACSSSWVVVASSWFKARCVPAAGASSPGGVIDAVEVANVCSLCLAVRPFGGPTPGRLLRRLLTSAPSRRALPRAALCASMVIAATFFDTQRAARRGAWFLVSRCGPIRVCHLQHAPHAMQISPGKDANCRCVSGVGAPSPSAPHLP